MKRFILILLTVLSIAGFASAQNANRSGFFLEVGAGGLVGDTPRKSLTITNNVVTYNCLSGTALDFGFGGRFRINRHWAYELKIEGTFPTEETINNLVGRVLPVGFRYTSKEFWRNYSMFFHFNLGGAVAVNSGVNDYINDYFLFSENSEFNLDGYEGDEGYGVAYSVGVGLNITTHFYAEGFWNAQALFSCFGKNGKGMLHYGSAGLILGYRF